MAEITCKLSGLEKSFGRNHVLRGIDLELRAGEVTALMGANGAGKSTLVKVLCGYHFADAGKIELGGEPFAPTDAADAIAKGVVTVHQSIDDGVIPDLDVATNLTLDRLTEPGVGLFVNDRKLRQQAREVAESMGLTMDVRTRVADLDVADRQMIAIARAMARAPKLLILDEPDTFVDNRFEGELYEKLEKLNEELAILLVSHDVGTITSCVKSIACVNKYLHYHPSNVISQEQLANYNCPIQIISHGEIPHTVLKHHHH